MCRGGFRVFAEYPTYGVRRLPALLSCHANGTHPACSSEFLSSALQAFDAVVEASGSSQGIKLASAMTRPMGSIILKSTCSAVSDVAMPAWSDIANDVVVNEKRLQGSRCVHVSPLNFRS